MYSNDHMYRTNVHSRGFWYNLRITLHYMVVTSKWYVSPGPSTGFRE